MDAPAAGYTCPHCQQLVEVPEIPKDAVVQCPHCGAEFSLPAPEPDETATPNIELDGLRIRQLAALRRGAYRTRSFAIVAAAACAVTVAQLVWMTVRHVRGLGWGVRPIAYLVLVPIAVGGAWYFLSRAIAAHQEAKQSALAQPTQPPDFSMLSDGSQQVKNLEDMR
jgi:hypothetical protein